MEKLGDLYNERKSAIYPHEIHQPLSEYALQDLKEIFKPFKIEIKQEMIANNRARVNFIGKNAYVQKDQFVDYYDELSTLNIPNNWKKPFTNLHNQRKFTKYELDRNSADFKRI
jgi:hypothetical protein